MAKLLTAFRGPHAAIIFAARRPFIIDENLSHWAYKIDHTKASKIEKNGWKNFCYAEIVTIQSVHLKVQPTMRNNIQILPATVPS